MDGNNERIVDYLLLPAEDYYALPPSKTRLRIPIVLAHRYDTLDEIFYVLARARL